MHVGSGQIQESMSFMSQHVMSFHEKHPMLEIAEKVHAFSAANEIAARGSHIPSAVGGERSTLQSLCSLRVFTNLDIQVV